jgi:Carboxypeptidase regulatory-like domain/TonB dependent receptor/TonB-dependent Receptor Plug Domain
MTQMFRAACFALSFSLLCLMILPSSARAQTVAVSDVSGTVTDQSGAAVPNAKVQMIEVDKQQSHATITDAAGHYTLPSLPVGPYKLEVQAPGFSSYAQTGIELQVASNVTLNVAMKVGSVNETVEVTANAAMVETKENSITQVVDEKRIVELPLNGRNLTQLLTLTGGGTTAPAGDLTGSKNIQGSNGSGTFAVAGSQANGVSYLLDGGDNNDAFSNVNLPIPFPDAVEEFSVQTSAMPAQYGLHPGGVVNIVTKSGSNGFHGDVFDFLRNYKLNARQKATPARDSLKRNQFGGVAGGRIIKDKLFYFGGYQQTVQRSNPANNQAHVPTAAALTGDFTTLEAAQSAGGCLATARTLKDPLAGNTNAPFAGNKIPVSRFDPAAVKLLTNFIPTSSDPCGLTFFGQPANNPDYQYIGRVDYVRSEKHNIFGRYYLYNYTAQTFFDGKNALTTGPNPGNRDRSQTVTVGDTYAFTPTKLNSFHATFDRRADNRGSAANLFSPNALGVNMFDNIPNYIQLTISNYFNVACGTCAPGYFNVNNYQVSDDFTLIKGRHQFGFGFDYRKEQFNSTNNQQSNGQITFNGGITGDALADLLIGRMSNFTDGNALSDYMRQTVFAFYAQDTFRVSPRLTLNLGIRWEPELPADDKQNRGNQFSLPAYLAGYHTVDPRYPNAPAGLLFAVDPNNQNGAQFTKNHWTTFSPRIGLVWDPTGSGKQTIRTAFALIHDSMELFYPERWTTNPPYASSISLANPSGPFSNPWLGQPGGNPFPGAAIFPASGVYVSIPPDVHATYMMQWNLSYQRQLGKDWLVTANYLGNRTDHILGAREINPAVFTGSTTTSTTGNTAARRTLTLLNAAQGAQYGSIIQTDDGNNANYNGLLTSLNHRFASHYTMLLNYTYSKCISTYDFGGELAGNNYQNPNSRAQERGPCNFDRRQIFNATLVAISGGLGNGITKQVTKDWSISPIISAFTGQPFSVTDGGVDNSLTAVGADRPNQVLGGNIYLNTEKAWFNQQAFKVQAPGTFGNAGRDSLYGPGSFNWDMALSREFHFKERYRVDVRADFFNVMNHANWNAPTNSITSGTFGQVTAFSSPRIIQMAMKFFF